MYIFPWSAFCFFIAFLHASTTADRIDDDIYDFRYPFPSSNFQYVVSWKVDGPYFVFRVEAPTKGWCGLGFSPSGTMGGADLVLGGVLPNGVGYVYDRHALRNGYPPLDAHQDYELLDSRENGTYTTLKYRRLIALNNNEDYFITNTPIYLLWSINTMDATDGINLVHHSDRGRSDVKFNLLAKPSGTVSNTTTTNPTTVAPLPAAVFVPLGPTYPMKQKLDRNGDFHLFWTFDQDTVTFEAHVASRGWGGIGFSPNGGMAGADIVVFWFDKNGRPWLSDRHADFNGFPAEDDKHDYELLGALKNDTHLIFNFRRKRNTCDGDDYIFTDDTLRIIFSKNDIVPIDKNNFQQHTFRDTTSALLFQVPSPLTDLPPPNATPIDFLVDNVQLPEADTLYWCRIFQLPAIPDKRYMIKFEPVFNPAVTVVHHMLMFKCFDGAAQYVGPGAPCYESAVGLNMSKLCQGESLAGWAVGAEPVVLPEPFGFPLFGKSGAHFVMIEIHYNIKFMKGLVDSSGMRIWHTGQLRQIEVGEFKITTPYHAPEYTVIPSRQSEYTEYVYCSADCTDDIPDTGITIVGAQLHSHLAARKIRLQHYRNGRQLPPIISDEHYDFNYQMFRTLNTPRVVLPGDQLVLECVYSTLDRNSTVFGGWSTHEEMCIVFMSYFPKVYGTFFCGSFPRQRDRFNVLGIDVVPSPQPLSFFNPYSETKVRFSDNSVAPLNDYLSKQHRFDWTDDLVKRFQSASRNGVHTAVCVRQDMNVPNFTEGDISRLKLEIFEQNGYPNITRPLVVPNVCPLQLS